MIQINVAKVGIKRVVIFGLFIFMAVLLFVVYLNSARNRKPPTETFVPLYIQNKYRDEIPSNLVIEPSSLKLPSTIPVLEVKRKTITKTEATDISKKIGFTLEPLEYRAQSGDLKYIWIDGNRSLIVTPTQNEVKYSFLQIEVANKKTLAEEELWTLASSFLEKISLPEMVFNRGTISFLKAYKAPEGEGYTNAKDKKDVDLYRLSFLYKNSGYEIVTPQTSQPMAVVNITPNGEVSSAKLLLLDIYESSQKVDVLSYQELEDSLNQAALINIWGDYRAISDLEKGSIENVNIDTVKIAYLLTDYKPGLLYPVFLLEGETRVKNSNTNKATLYLPASKPN